MAADAARPSPGPATSGSRLRAAAERWLQGVWWDLPQRRPEFGLIALSWVYRALKAAFEMPWALGWRRPVALPVPVIVVGNWVVGGAGKTPVVIALAQALRQRGWTPGIISRGHGRRGTELILVHPSSDADAVGDEPLLIARRTQAPLWVGRRRAQAALALCENHPQLDLLISDDGLQHRALHRDLQLVVFGERGVGNGCLLPAGPMREPMPEALGSSAVPTWVLYGAGRQSTPLPGALCGRQIRWLLPLRDWHAGLHQRAEAVASWAGREVHAAAAIAHPQAFFEMLRSQGLRVVGHAMADHAMPLPRPWPTGASPVVVTEKDAVKIAPESADAADIWVATLDLHLPDELLDALVEALEPLRRRRSPLPHPR